MHLKSIIAIMLGIWLQLMLFWGLYALLPGNAYERWQLLYPLNFVIVVVTFIARRIAGNKIVAEAKSLVESFAWTGVVLAVAYVPLFVPAIPIWIKFPFQVIGLLLQIITCLLSAVGAIPYEAVLRACHV